MLWPILGVPILLVCPILASLIRGRSQRQTGAPRRSSPKPQTSVADDVDGSDGAGVSAMVSA